jgi:hypothetical protein
MNEKIRAIYSSKTDTYGQLGKRLEFGARTCVSKNEAGMKAEFFTPTVEVLFGIGKDHVGRLIMDEDAWLALNKNEKVNIETLEEFKKKFIYPKNLSKKKPIRNPSSRK